MSNFTKYETYSWTAKKNGKEFKLTVDQVEQICARPCTFCGTLAGDLTRRERIDGYTLANCIPACKFCKNAKGKATTPDFWRWIDRVVEHRMRTRPVQAGKRTVKPVVEDDEDGLLAHEEADEAN